MLASPIAAANVAPLVINEIHADPDLTGDFVQHTTTGGGTGPRFSPGRRVGGSPFATNCQNPQPSVTVGEGIGGPGDSVNIPLGFDAMSGDYDGLSFEIIYDATRFSTVTCTLDVSWQQGRV